MERERLEKQRLDRDRAVREDAEMQRRAEWERIERARREHEERELQKWRDMEKNRLEQAKLVENFGDFMSIGARGCNIDLFCWFELNRFSGMQKANSDFLEERAILLTSTKENVNFMCYQELDTSRKKPQKCQELHKVLLT